MKTIYRRLPALAALLASAFALVPGSKAVTYSFVEITNNSAINVASQLSVQVNDLGGGMVGFKFFNNVGLASSITDIYFQATGFTPPPIITPSGAGVAFSTPASPSDLPGGNPGFVTTLNLSADSDSPVASNGVNSSTEWVQLGFGYGGYSTFNGVLGAIDAGTLRVGLHIQALSDGESESYVNNGPSDIPPPVPEGGWTVALLGLAFGLLALARRQMA